MNKEPRVKVGQSVKKATHGGHAFGYDLSIFRFDTYQTASNKLTAKQKALRRAKVLKSALCFVGK